MNKKELCKKIMENENIVIVGPDCTERRMLRVYNSGGRIARIYVGDKKDKKSELMSMGYVNWCKKDANKLKNILKNATTEEKITNAILSKDYLDLSQDAVNNRHGTKNKKSNNDNKEQKERNIETQIVKKFMNSKGNWIAIDMEVQCPKAWFENMKSDEEINKLGKIITEQPRFDIISFSKEGIGIIELKVNNENCDNLLSHYAHMKHILNNKDKFMKEIYRRIKYLKENELINSEIIDKYGKQIFNEKKLWCGFLFVGGDKSKSINLIEQFNKFEIRDKLKFMYCDFNEIDLLNINNMQNYSDFIKESEK